MVMQMLLHTAALICVAAIQRRSDTLDDKLMEPPNQIAGQSQVLPPVAPLLHGPQDTFDAIQTQIASFQDTLASQEHEAIDEIRRQKAAYERRLVSQRANNRAALAMNTFIEEKIKTTQAAIQGLRQNVSLIQEENRVLSTTLETLVHNISIAQEFALGSLNVSKKRLDAAPELQILKNLEARDADIEHKKSLAKFADGIIREDLSMLRISDNGLDANEVIARLGSQLSEASAEKDASLAKLKHGFEQLWKEGESRQAELVKQQQQLNETLHSAEVLKNKLIAAVQHLTITKNQLSESVNALVAFGDALGSKVNTTPVSKIAPTGEILAAAPNIYQTLHSDGYQIQERGASGCPDGFEIKTLTECEQAVATLKLSMRPTWNRSHPKIPQWCSYKETGSCENTHCMHFNDGGIGIGRHDLAPICRSS